MKTQNYSIRVTD